MIKLKVFSPLLFLMVATSGIYSAPSNALPLPMTHQIFHYAGYTVCYDARTKCPCWVYEVLTAEGLEGGVSRDNFQFREVELLPDHMRAAVGDYAGSGFDRGHMAPAADCKGSEDKMRDSFLLSNVCPQDPEFNRGYWARLEKHVRELTKTAAVVHVISGPLYLPETDESVKRWVKYQVIGNNSVAAPTHFFKVIVLEEAARNKKSLAYVLPNAPIQATTPLDKFETTVKKVESLSGIFFGLLLSEKVSLE